VIALVARISPAVPDAAVPMPKLLNCADPLDVNVVNAPVLAVVLPIGVLLIADIETVPPTFSDPLIPTPPVTTNAPVVVLDVAVPEAAVRTPLTESVLPAVNAPGNVPAPMSAAVSVTAPLRPATLVSGLAIADEPDLSHTPMLALYT
jgi:hypothetical protein